MPKKRKVGSVSDFSLGIISRTVDLLLISIYYGFEFAVTGYGKGWRKEAKTIKRAARYLKQKGLVKDIKDGRTMPELTEEGNRKVDQLVPKYNNKRFSDGRIYMITYDIPQKRNAKRNLLRRYLRSIGCALLQQSVWVTPYNPSKKITAFVDQHKLQGQILVSSLGKEGTIGDMKVSDLMGSLYSLEKLNKRYKKFIVKAGLGEEPKHTLVFNYLSILKDDPQIPFDLLPQGWLGDHAYEVFRRILG